MHNASENKHLTMSIFQFMAIFALTMLPTASAMTTSRTSASMLHGYKSKLSINYRSNTSSNLNQRSWKSIAVSNIHQSCKPHKIKLKASPITGIALDQPLLPTITTKKNFFSTFKSLMTTMLLSDVCKATIIAFIVAFGISMLTRTANTSIMDTISHNIQSFFHKLRNKLSYYYNTISNLFSKSTQPSSIPMSFDNQWGVCTLHSKQPLAKNPLFIEYKFALPHDNMYVPLHLGQGLVFTSLDNQDNVVTGDFYLNSPRYSNGHISIILPKIIDDQTYLFGTKERLNMVSFI